MQVRGFVSGHQQNVYRERGTGACAGGHVRRVLERRFTETGRVETRPHRGREGHFVFVSRMLQQCAVRNYNLDGFRRSDVGNLLGKHIRAVLDEKGRLWFCGRKAHRVFTEGGVMYTIPCEAIFNEYPEVKRTALVGVGKEGAQKPVLVVELAEGFKPVDRIVRELEKLAAGNELTTPITTFLFHPSFPVDIRHNAKIFREQLAIWASDQLHEHEQG